TAARRPSIGEGETVITQDDLGRLTGVEVYDNAGERIGVVSQIYVDNRTGDPIWITVRMGSLSFEESFVPLQGAELTGDRLTVTVGRDRVKQAPLLDTGSPVSQEDAERLCAHYGVPPTADTEDGEDREASEDDAMTRSEERLVVGTRREPTTRVRLRKYLVTEHQQITVPVTREEVRLEEVPVTADEPGGTVASDDVDAGHEVTLKAERPVVTTETVPVERVRLRKEAVQDEETVSGEVRKERIDYEGPDPASPH
ncbi:PRC and DUF2382 domain-containing protein, partial [Actinoplanes sp. NPDC051633]|uniref:PRC and DUF2382 domain-containing protein n=1 Tax=Actinoplanes sp. NPDC051633 TaxID=3155670 RepID=UPI0034148423